MINLYSGAIGFAFATFILAFFKNFYFASGAMILGGMAWITVLTTFTTLVQQVVSPWVRARALSIFLAIFFGGMSLGSLLWGWIATHYTFSTALSVAAIGLLACNFLTYIFVSGIEPEFLSSSSSAHCYRRTEI